MSNTTTRIVLKLRARENKALVGIIEITEGPLLVFEMLKYVTNLSITRDTSILIVWFM